MSVDRRDPDTIEVLGGKPGDKERAMDRGSLAITYDVYAARRLRREMSAAFSALDMEEKHGGDWRPVEHGFDDSEPPNGPDERAAQPVAGAVAQPKKCHIVMDEGSSQPESSPRCQTCGEWRSEPCNKAQAAPAPEPSRLQKMREAGFTARDTRLTCDECGAKFTPQFAPLHECAQPEPSAQALDIAFELGRVEAMQETSAFNASALRKALSAMLTHFGMDEDEWNKPTLDQARAALAEYDSFTLHPATADLVRRFSQALAEKLAAAEAKYGYSDGWASPDWMDECRTKLMEHIAKGDPRDVAAYCAFLWHHGASTAHAVVEAVPLNFDQLQKVMSKHFGGRELTDDEADSAEAFARAIERAHGIAPKAAQEKT